MLVLVLVLDELVEVDEVDEGVSVSVAGGTGAIAVVVTVDVEVEVEVEVETDVLAVPAGAQYAAGDAGVGVRGALGFPGRRPGEALAMSRALP